MQFLMNFGLLSLFAIAVSAGASKFADSCHNINGSGTTLRADCREHKDGQFRTTTLDLNRCIKNNKGGLQCKKNGEYAGSCINCTLRDNSEFECQCRNAKDGHPYVRATIDLNKCISNNHGELGC